MSLRAIFCQHKAVGILQRAIAAGKMPHSYVFVGAEGVGKFKTAMELARLLLCESPTCEDNFADSCGLCESCRLFEVGSHPDFHHVYKELAQFTKQGKDKKTPVDLQIDVVREFLIDKVSAKPTLSKRRVFVVTEAERLNIASQNALLKVLEEPPSHCCIILLCTRLHRLLPTTKSRCQIVHFGPIDAEIIAEKLHKMGLADNKAEYFARFAQGSLGRACQLARLELSGAELYKTKKQLLKAFSSYKLPESLELAGWICEQSKRIAAVWNELDETTSKKDISRRAQKTLIRIIVSALCDVMKFNIAQTEGIINFEQRELIEKLAGGLKPEQAAERIADVCRLESWTDSAVNERLIFEQLLLRSVVSDTINAF